MSRYSDQMRVNDEVSKLPTSRSLRGLDGLNFLMADVRDGLGPFLSVYLKGTQHWGSGNIGLVMAASGIAAAICQIPAGLLVDAVRMKRLLVAISGLLVGTGCLLIAFFPETAGSPGGTNYTRCGLRHHSPLPRGTEPWRCWPSVAACADKPQ